MRIKFRRKRVTAWKPITLKRLVDAATLAQKTARPGDIDEWEKQTFARLRFAHLWYEHKLSRGAVSYVDFLAYLVMTAI